MSLNIERIICLYFTLACVTNISIPLKLRERDRVRIQQPIRVFDIVECGAKIWTQGSYESGLEQVYEEDIEFEHSE